LNSDPSGCQGSDPESGSVYHCSFFNIQ